MGETVAECRRGSSRDTAPQHIVSAISSAVALTVALPSLFVNVYSLLAG